MPIHSSQLERRVDAAADHGAAAIEFAIVIGLLALIFSGVFDIGLAYRRSIEMSGTLRSGGRVVSNLGDYGPADYEGLLALNAGIVEIGAANVQRVIIYRSSTDDGVVPQNCKDLSPSASAAVGITDLCNVYSPTQLATLTAADFTADGAATCDASDWDFYFCPVEDRETQQSAGLTYVGIWMEVTYDFPIGLIPGDGLTLADSVVHRVEPEL